MSLIAIQCTVCGGAISQKPGEELPRCLFCDSEALEAVEPDAGIEAPEIWLPFELDESGAAGYFRAWASSSIWMPSDLRQARVELHRLLLPAWVWSGRLETHWAGLVSAMTRSGKRPVSGQDEAIFDGVLVPSSTALSRRELAAISPFQLGAARDVATEAPDEPFELGGITRRGARAEAVEQMKARHGARLQRQEGTSRLNLSTLDHDLDGQPLLLPIYIGVFRRKEKFYRVVINGQSGALVGDAPLSWLKILGAAAAVSLLIFVLLWALTS